MIKLPSRKKVLFSIGTATVAGLSAMLLAEILIRFVNPQQTMHPRWAFSAAYGFEPFKNVEMVHKLPGKWRFTYTTNAYGHRGPTYPISNAYPKRNIVALGDSHTFGMGVNDGEEYPTILKNELSNQFDVVNLGVGGWGLTQQIRRFYEIGQLYRPDVVILQYTGNDPEDNFNNPVTTIENGRFSFRDSNNSVNFVKKYLSNSIIQKSQLYNLIRFSGHLFVQRLNRERTVQAFEETRADSIPAEERYHIELLEMFAKDLVDRGIVMLMIAVNNHLEIHPNIKNAVMSLDSANLLRYVEVAEWFVGVEGYASPEGHEWGTKAHRIIGVRLAREILELPLR